MRHSARCLECLANCPLSVAAAAARAGVLHAFTALSTLHLHAPPEAWTWPDFYPALAGCPPSLRELHISLPNLLLGNENDELPPNLRRLGLIAAPGGSIGLSLSPSGCPACAAGFWGALQELHLTTTSGAQTVSLCCRDRLEGRPRLLPRPGSMLVVLEHMLPAMRSCTRLALHGPDVVLCYSGPAGPAAAAQPEDQPAVARFLQCLAWALAGRTRLLELEVDAYRMILRAVPVGFHPNAWLQLVPVMVPAGGVQVDCGHGFTAACRRAADSMHLRMWRAPG